ncbi:AAEL004140-PA [Aedes aegypti]|uniref:AAEL004140-PA n=1 Tax=Aedes aegypti TaxID=7159 RepID=Q17DK3_AEDAE|nr:AAEL004140-PA [Aedes aegypti]
MEEFLYSTLCTPRILQRSSVHSHRPRFVSKVTHSSTAQTHSNGAITLRLADCVSVRVSYLPDGVQKLLPHCDLPPTQQKVTALPLTIGVLCQAAKITFSSSSRSVLSGSSWCCVVVVWLVISAIPFSLCAAVPSCVLSTGKSKKRKIHSSPVPVFTRATSERKFLLRSVQRAITLFFYSTTSISRRFGSKFSEVLIRIFFH